MHSERIKYLLDGYLAKTLSLPEMEEFLTLTRQADADPLLNGIVEQIAREQDPAYTIAESDAKAAIAGIVAVDKKMPVYEEELPFKVTSPVHFLRKWYYAAAVVLIIGTGSYLWYHQSDNVTVITDSQFDNQPDIAPGSNKATLTLADGSSLLLDSASNGTLAEQGNMQVVKSGDGQIIYKPKGKAGEQVMMNTMRTPRGGQFQLTLPDGTKVWLNNASSIRYPVVFTGNERTVAVTGEVYFEVAKQTKMPFRVNIGNKGLVEVLGTHFNINAYQNERTINTTLLEGAVRVQTGTAIVASNNTASQQSSVVLKPGQQAQLLNTMAGSTVQAKTDKKQITVLNKIDTDQIMAWKNGLFNFNNMPFDEAMRQLERWYDIEVVYEKGIPDNIELNGEMTKGITLNDLLIVLQKIGVKCKLDGKKLLVSP